jgi:hypothetical protein
LSIVFRSHNNSINVYVDFLYIQLKPPTDLVMSLIIKVCITFYVVLLFRSPHFHGYSKSNEINARSNLFIELDTTPNNPGLREVNKIIKSLKTPPLEYIVIQTKTGELDTVLTFRTGEKKPKPNH